MDTPEYTVELHLNRVTCCKQLNIKRACSRIELDYLMLHWMRDHVGRRATFLTEWQNMPEFDWFVYRKDHTKKTKDDTIVFAFRDPDKAIAFKLRWQTDGPSGMPI